MSKITILNISCEIALSWMAQTYLVNIDSGNGFGLRGNQVLPEPMLTQIYIAIWYH